MSLKSPIGSIIRSLLYKPGDTVNILSTPYNLEYMEKICVDNVHIYMWEDLSKPLGKDPTVTNLHIINGNKSTLPYHINFDLIICHDMLQSYKFAKPISQTAHIPLIAIEHMTKQEYGTELNEIKDIQINDILFDSKDISDSWENIDLHRIITDKTNIIQHLSKVLGRGHIR